MILKLLRKLSKELRIIVALDILTRFTSASKEREKLNQFPIAKPSMSTWVTNYIRRSQKTLNKSHRNMKNRLSITDTKGTNLTNRPQTNKKKRKKLNKLRYSRYQTRVYIYRDESEIKLINKMLNDQNDTAINIKSDDGIVTIKESDSHTLSLKPLNEVVKSKEIEEDCEIGPLPNKNENVSINTESINFNDHLHRRLLNTRMSLTNKETLKSVISEPKNSKSRFSKMKQDFKEKHECNCKLFLDPKIHPKDRLIFIKPQDIERFKQDYKINENEEENDVISCIKSFDSALLKIFNEREDLEFSPNCEIDTDDEIDCTYDNVMRKINCLRDLVISNMNNFQSKHDKLVDENKRERHVLLDIVKMEQKHNSQLRILDTNLPSFKEGGLTVLNEPSKTEEEIPDNSSLSIDYDSYDENSIKYNYEINIKNKAIEVFQEKLIALTAQLKIEQQQYEELQTKFESVSKSKSELLEENKLLK